jgi:hypothetical protein
MELCGFGVPANCMVEVVGLIVVCPLAVAPVNVKKITAEAKIALSDWKYWVRPVVLKMHPSDPQGRVGTSAKLKTALYPETGSICFCDCWVLPEGLPSLLPQAR